MGEYYGISLPFIMTVEKLKRISVSVDSQEYDELKKLTRSGMSVGFLIREAIHRFLKEAKQS